MLEIKNLSVNVKDKEILKDINLKLEKGKVYLLAGKNGSGKSTLLNVLMGNPVFEVTNGEVILDDENILNLSVDKRAKKGMFLSFQNPEEIEGVKFTDFLGYINKKRDEKSSIFAFAKNMQNEIKNLEISTDITDRYLNVGFSGGEKKKNEILQMKILKPKYLMLDEVDSGLDIDAAKVVAENIREYIEEEKEDKILIIVSHHFDMLKTIGVDEVIILDDGRVLKTGGKELLKEMQELGFKGIKN